MPRLNLPLPFPPGAPEGSRVERHAFHSHLLPGHRNLRVYLPPGYRNAWPQTYPVLYMQDGQKLFGHTPDTWRLQQVLDAEIAAGSIEPLIVIGIDHGGSDNEQDRTRIAEYTFTADPSYGGGNAAHYGNMLLKEIHPWVARRYRLRKGRQHTAIGGASLGALVSLTLAMEHTTVFGKVAALSPSLWWNQEAIFSWMTKAATRTTQRPRLWLDMGEQEGASHVARLHRFRDHLLADGWRPPETLHMHIEPEAAHHESHWSARLNAVLHYLFPVPSE